MAKTIAEHLIVSGGGQLIVGGDKIPLPLVGFSGATLPPGGPIPGAAYISGPLMVGQRGSFQSPANQGTVMVTRVNPLVAAAYVPPRPIISIQNSLPFVDNPTDVLIGNIGAPVGVSVFSGVGGINIVCGSYIERKGPEGKNIVALFDNKLAALQKEISSKISAGFRNILGIQANLSATIESGAKTNSAIMFSPCGKFPVMNGYATGNKSIGAFDIPHWTKKNTRIRHIIAEGPEAGIYIRGRLTNKNMIELPEYWDGLIDPDSITVTLTQIGYSQDLIVESIDWGKVVKIKSGSGANIDCFYEVWAARWIDPMNHDEKLHVVYEGDSPDDYPGNKENFLVGGWDYDRRIPKWGKKSEEEK